MNTRSISVKDSLVKLLHFTLNRGKKNFLFIASHEDKIYREVF